MMDHLLSQSRGPLSTAEILNTLGSSTEDETPRKEREIIQSNRVKLTEYIHDVTLLFPFMKERTIFTVDDCDLVRSEQTGTLKVDKFLDILLTKGPKAIGVFHEALDVPYAALFDYLVHLFINAGVQLPPSRQPRDRDQISERASNADKQKPSTGSIRGTIFRHGSHTVRRSLEVLTQQCQFVQKERDDLQNALIQREKEIHALLSSREAFHYDLVAVTSKYQELLSELVDWRNLLSNQSEGTTKKLQELLSERDSIQMEYDQIEGEFLLVCSELSAARDRIMKLLSHLERSEKVVTITQEEKEKFIDKLELYQGENQRLLRKIERFRREKDEGESVCSEVGDRERELEEQCQQLREVMVDLSQLQEELDNAVDRLGEVQSQMDAVRKERKEAIVEKEEIVAKHWKERQRRKKLEDLHKHADAMSNTSVPPPSPLPTPPELLKVKLEDVTVVMQAPSSEDPGMKLGQAVVVVDLVENGVAAAHGVNIGDQIREVNHINVSQNQDPLGFAKQLLSAAANAVTVSIKRQVPFSSTPSVTTSFPFTSATLTPTSTGLHDLEALRRKSNTGNFLLKAPRQLSAERHRVLKSQTSGFSSATSTTSNSVDKSHDEQTTSSEGRPASVSEDGGSSDSGSEVEGCPIPRVSRTSDENTGVVQSPTGLGCEDLYNSFDLPDTITEWGTFISSGAEQFHPRDSDFPDDIVLPSLQRGVRSFENGDQESDPDEPRTYKRRGQHKLIYRRGLKSKDRRLSHSLDDVAKIDSTSQEMIISPKVQRRHNRLPGEYSHRRILLPRGKLGAGLRLVGGRGYGIFVHSDRQANSGLHTGDEITKVGVKAVDNKTYAEVVELFDYYREREEKGQSVITVEHNMEGYSQLPSSHARDNFYVRAKFSHSHKVLNGVDELSFEKGTIFHVMDTLPSRQLGAWHVERIGSHGEVMETGFVPTVISPTEMVEARMATSLPISILQGFSPKLRGRKEATVSIERSKSKIPASCGFRLYEPIRKVEVTEPRPVVLVGALEVDIRRYLVERGSTEEIKFCYCRRESSDQLGQYSAEEVVEELEGSNDGHTMVSTTEHVHKLAQQGFHCVLCIGISDLGRPALVQLCPIVLLLEAKHTRAIRKLRESAAIPPERWDNAQLHIERAKEAQRKYSHFITGEIDMGSHLASRTLSDVIVDVRQMVARQQKLAIWELQ